MPPLRTEATPKAVPLATYRLQFNRGFRFVDAEAILPYLRDLGISHVYASPIVMAVRGSAHGYDVLDPTRTNPELGTEAEFQSFLASLRSEALGLILDIVPNHMAADDNNPWWRDVLLHGRRSRYALYFDIDWERGQGKLLLPVLGKPLDETIADREVSVVKEGEPYSVAYFDRRWPISPASYGIAAQAASGDHNALPRLLDAQAYRLVYWRATTPNYRRFFDINSLVGLRVEDPDVFAAVHAFPMSLVAAGAADGLRVDHVDGLRDPLAYTRRLRNAVGSKAYLVVEKVLGRGEHLPREWPVEGTTGYDFLAAVNGLFADPAGLAHIGRAYAKFTGVRQSFQAEVRFQKREVLSTLFANEVESLSEGFGEVLRRDLGLHEVSVPVLTEVLKDVTAELPVYRTYADSEGMSAQGKGLLDAVFSRIAPLHMELTKTLEGLHRVLTLDYPPGLSSQYGQSWLGLVMRWQQISGSIMAKGLEDTAFYRYNRLISLNEVGGQAEACSPQQTHRFLAGRRHSWPYAMNATSTHDTKRSEDVRTRITVLTWMAPEWGAAVERWHRWNSRWKREVSGSPAPDANMEWLIYQTLVGAWPLYQTDMPAFSQRLRAFLTKAAREAKDRTGWLEVNVPYEEALLEFAQAILDPARSPRFVSDVERFVKRIAPVGAAFSLAQLAVKLTAPGVPDIYQGQEVWDFSLTDPDNRRPVEYGGLASSLASLTNPSALMLSGLLSHWRDGRLKQFVTSRLLLLRRDRPALFHHGSYAPLRASPSTDVFAFARRHKEDWCCTLVPRRIFERPLRGGLPLGKSLVKDSRVRLPSGAPVLWQNVLTGEVVKLGPGQLAVERFLRRFPVAVLVSPIKADDHSDSPV